MAFVKVADGREGNRAHKEPDKNGPAVAGKERRAAGAPAACFRSGSPKSRGPARLLARSANAIAAAFHSHPRLVPLSPGRGRKITVAQLSGEPALRRPE